jgi:hypothetical protein
LNTNSKRSAEEIAAEERRTTAIGLCLQAESFLQAADYIWKASKSGELSIRFDSPAVFLLSHGIELALKAWLRKSGKTLKNLSAIGHDLSKACQHCKENPLPIDEDSLFLEWARLKPELHLSDSAVITEEDRVRAIPKSIRKVSLLRQFLLLDNLHGKPYMLRYHRADLYKYPNVDFVIFFGMKLCAAIRPFCEDHYNKIEKKS